jgi:adenosylhomocysteine nucleosidase
VALPGEARTLTGKSLRAGEVLALQPGLLVAVSGMGPARAAAAAERLLQRGAVRLATWGTAGGLDRALCCGQLLLPERVTTDDGRDYAVDAAWRRRLAQVLATQAPAGGVLLGSDRALTSAADKQVAFRSSGAVAVDMESAAVAAVAQAHQRPFTAVRAVIDIAAETLPAAALAAIDDNGRMQPVPLLRRLAAHPAEVLALMTLARRFGCARRRLAAAAALCIEELASAVDAERKF